jgi:hypothetical protein
MNANTGPFPNMDSYKNGNVVQTGISITNISLPGSKMMFITLSTSAVTPTTSCATSYSKADARPHSYSGYQVLLPRNEDRPFSLLTD